MADSKAKDAILAFLTAAALSEALNPSDTDHILLDDQTTTPVNDMDMTDKIVLLDAALVHEAGDDTPDRQKASLLARELSKLPVTYDAVALHTEFLDMKWKEVEKAIESRRADAVRVMENNLKLEEWQSMRLTPRRRAALVGFANALAAGVIIQEVAWMEMKEDLKDSIGKVIPGVVSAGIVGEQSTHRGATANGDGGNDDTAREVEEEEVYEP